MAQLLLSENDETKLDLEQVQKTHIDQLLLQAVMQQVKMGMTVFPKGFISLDWIKVQKEWCKMNDQKIDSDRWEFTFIKCIQDYTQAMWVKRNQILHGEDESQQIEIIKMKCKKRIRELYKRSRQKLSLEDKKLFQMPLIYRLKGTCAGMTLWIERAEMIFQQKEQDENNMVNTKYWIFKQNKKWLKLVPTIT